MTKDSLWIADAALNGFEMRRLIFPDDYDGAVVATLVRRKAESSSKKAVLYIHGYMDYFFQTHLADCFIQNGYHFYALDLRKYGRSLQAGQHPNYCQDIREYFAEISEALRIISAEEGNEYIVLNGHSTGGLTSSLYAASGEYRNRINALILNSPFFEFNVTGALKYVMQVLGLLAPLIPFAGVSSKNPLPYIESIHKAHQGEWEFSLEWRNLSGFPIYPGWVRAIRNAHQEVRQKLNIQCPVLVLHSDKSIYGEMYNPTFQTGDAVLSVDHIREGSKNLGKNVKVVEIKDGLHDLILSRQAVCEETFKQMFSWLSGLA
jgi:alpha-beta hydrolase superfamily lysophospholipase